VGEGYLTQCKVKRQAVMSTAWPSKTRQYDPSKRREPLAQQHSVTAGTTLLEPHTSQHKDPSRYTAGGHAVPSAAGQATSTVLYSVRRPAVIV